MGKCSLCSHAESAKITADLFGGITYREIARRYNVTIAAISLHLKNHVAGPIQRIAEAERQLREAAALIQPTLNEMRKLNARALRILAIAEASKDHETALKAIHQCRLNLELISKLTGELDPKAAADNAGPVQIVVNYRERPLPAWQQPAVDPAKPVIDALPAPEPASTGDA